MRRLLLGLFSAAVLACGESSTGPTDEDLIGMWTGVVGQTTVTLTLTTQNTGITYGSAMVTTTGIGANPYPSVSATTFGDSLQITADPPSVSSNGLFFIGARTRTTLTGTISGDVRGSITFRKQ